MPDETKTVVLTQPEGERLAHEHEGGLALYGDRERPPMSHRAEMVHVTAPARPLVHMVCWEQEEPCKVEVSGRVTLAGDRDAPVQVAMAHSFTNPHHQTHAVEPLDHTLKVSTALAQPIHHALQMRTPLQVRFCNPWHVASDYSVEVRSGERSLFSIRLTGATVATPQPCVEELCPPAVSHPQRP
jgi:hypothetical protein